MGVASRLNRLFYFYKVFVFLLKRTCTCMHTKYSLLPISICSWTTCVPPSKHLSGLRFCYKTLKNSLMMHSGWTYANPLHSSKCTQTQAPSVPTWCQQTSSPTETGRKRSNWQLCCFHFPPSRNSIPSSNTDSVSNQCGHTVLTTAKTLRRALTWCDKRNQNIISCHFQVVKFQEVFFFFMLFWVF